MKRWAAVMAVVSGTALAGYKTVEKQIWTPDYCWRVTDKYGVTKCCESEPPKCDWPVVDCGIDPNWGRSHLQCYIAGVGSNYGGFIVNPSFQLPIVLPALDGGVDPAGRGSKDRVPGAAAAG